MDKNFIYYPSLSAGSMVSAFKKDTKFEDGTTAILIIDRVNSWGYTANTVIATNLGSLQNRWCATNMYLRSNS